MSYKVGIIGTGFGAKVHLPALDHHKDFDVVSIAGRNPEKTAKIANEHGINHTTNWRELVEDSEIDIITVSTPPYHHFSMAKAALIQNKHLLLEKPTTTTAHQAKELLREVSERNLIAMMCHEFRWTPHRHYFTHLVTEEETLGTIKEIHYQSFASFAASPIQPKFGWLWDSLFDGGMLGAMGSHLIDQIRATTGREFLNIMGRISTRTPQRLGSDDEYYKVTADDGFSLLFTLEGGIEGTLNVSTTTAPAPEGRFIISGEEGTLYLQGSDIYLGRPNENFVKQPIPKEFGLPDTLGELDRRIPPFLKLLDQFSNSLDDGVALPPNLEDGWRNQLVLDAVRESHKIGSRVRIVDY